MSELVKPCHPPEVLLASPERDDDLDLEETMYYFDHKDHIIMTSSYERFSNDAENSDKLSVNLENGDQEKNLEDAHIQIHKADQSSGEFKVYDMKDQQPDQFIEDPAGNPFAPKGPLESLQFQVKKVVEHIAFRAVTVLLIILDFSLVIVDLTRDTCASVDSGLEIVSHIIITLFVIEVAARIFYQGKEFFYNVWDVLDMVIVVISFLIDMVFIGIESEQSCTESNHVDYAKLVVIGRVFRIIRIVRIIYFMVVQHRQVTRATRHVVSQNKRRYQKDGFDLDLCYITGNIAIDASHLRKVHMIVIIFHTHPKAVAFYRNPIREVARFFNTKHPGHYRIYNLCSERDYDETLFYKNVRRVFIDDHNVPKLEDMLKFTDDVREWMASDGSNIIAIHCKGGKGRTGTMICTWLIDCGLFEEAEESLTYFGDRRTDLSVGKSFQGVETPSQSRYVGYYEKIKNDNRQLPPKKYMKITSIKIEGITGDDGRCDSVHGDVSADDLHIFECVVGTGVNCQLMKYTDSDSIIINLQNSPRLEGDIKVMFHSTNVRLPKGYDKCPFYFWFNTAFIEDHKLHMARSEIDNPHKKKVYHVFRESFAIEVNFEDVNPDFL
ncbi:LOW QUALITY PROTEIN: phosphatidylinositol 3,4,5-trisphosphate 3-phosphatase TPTE2-like [Haliotis rubra]|uniref:LOW QUALITY PROTEIN: phosphatidylinositol 3,4,5-trisphosphate 3-phosphatase TPTE2-like n=1 Tax=Haliotis rubra TaxID=36100 RepID=UPI001EE5BABE|nr:LOW QUALITY PROTEIN: phosphatidylinositol 3,4,5-trisphosphate 3-phosphatase TPTE2-like [Haliotis rubra]